MTTEQRWKVPVEITLTVVVEVDADDLTDAMVLGEDHAETILPPQTFKSLGEGVLHHVSHIEYTAQDARLISDGVYWWTEQI